MVEGWGGGVVRSGFAGWVGGGGWEAEPPMAGRHDSARQDRRSSSRTSSCGSPCIRSQSKSKSNIQTGWRADGRANRLAGRLPGGGAGRETETGTMRETNRRQQTRTMSRRKRLSDQEVDIHSSYLRKDPIKAPNAPDLGAEPLTFPVRLELCLMTASIQGAASPSHHHRHLSLSSAQDD
ncbi:hypothetical protein INR49_032279 [Caranx melampygus]|nr:hypothetical protein INR49_032279 [Caranx melampygus]